MNDPRTLLGLAVEIIRELADFDGEAGEYADPRVEGFMLAVGTAIRDLERAADYSRPNSEEKQ
ncbi:MAG: hypothetical protein P8N94_02530 [Gammaproteobacteria bacterium]|nr:hypothetical protein [Gammaproteobacteria bacterium]